MWLLNKLCDKLSWGIYFKNNVFAPINFTQFRIRRNKTINCDPTDCIPWNRSNIPILQIPIPHTLKWDTRPSNPKLDFLSRTRTGNKPPCYTVASYRWNNIALSNNNMVWLLYRSLTFTPQFFPYWQFTDIRERYFGTRPL